MTPARPTGVSAIPFIPPRPSLDSMRRASQGCRGCPLYKNATQAVFGEGARGAHVMLVGEQPGNDEDIAGRPFVGPAGRVLDDALGEAGIDRSDAYVTNVVKHFKWVPQGTRRKHKKPAASEIAACLPWLEREVSLVRPSVLVLLGATASQALVAPDFKVSRMRGRPIESTLAPHAIATVHPSSILRQRTGEDRRREMSGFITDLRVAAKLIAASR